MSAVIAQSYDPAFPLDELTEFPGNPRRGDEGAISASIDAHGFYGAALVQLSTKRIIAGNHRTRVARAKGEVTVPVLLLDVDDEQAKRLMLVDNRSNDLAGYDDSALDAMLRELAELPIGLTGTGFEDLSALLQVPEFTPVDETAQLDHRSSVTCPSCGHSFVPG